MATGLARSAPRHEMHDAGSIQPTAGRRRWREKGRMDRFTRAPLSYPRRFRGAAISYSAPAGTLAGSSGSDPLNTSPKSE